MCAPAFVLDLKHGWWLTSVGFTFNYLAAGCILLSSGVWERWAWLRRATLPLQAFGRHSYSIYLWHMPIAAWVKFAMQEELAGGGLGWWWTFTLTYLAASLLVGVSMSKMIEQPLLRVRDRWFPSRSRHDAEAPPQPGIAVAGPA
jgi:peptidoglycan/LPS O-acetylase OafA/YrhL